MRYLPTNVRGTRDDAGGYGYLVTMPDGSEEWYRLAWQATARAHGWAPPADLMAQAREKARREAGEAEALVAEVRAREQRLMEALNDLELSDGAFRALVNAYLNPVSVTADDQKWAAEALRPIGGEPGGGERR